MSAQHRRSLSEVVQFGRTAAEYQHLRRTHPTVRALTVHRYIRDDYGLSLEQFECETERGHRFPAVDERERCLCSFCGADGDA